MESQSQLKFDRKTPTRIRYAHSNSTFYHRIADGLIPPPVSLGGRSVGWPVHETDQVLAFMMAGKSNDEIRLLVTRLVELRQNLAVEMAIWNA